MVQNDSNSRRAIDPEALVDYLTLEAEKRPAIADADFAAAAAMIENELGPALRQLGNPASHQAAKTDPSSKFESEPECMSAISKLAYLPSLPFTEAGAVQFLREYELLGELGRGGMGTVFRARHAKLGKLFALKVLSPKLPKNDRTVSRFLREMRAAGKIEHPNVVCATDASEVDGIHYLVMELVEGANLSQLVRSRGPLATADACEIIRLAATGLQAIHDHGLVHRDIKPSNLMLTSAQPQGSSEDSRAKPTVKILDLGLALLHESADDSITGTLDRVVGTAQYMAPEQFADSRGVDSRADLYSLGCTLHYLLTGAPPAPNGASLPVSGELEAVMKRLLAVNPSDRFSCASNVAKAISPFCAQADLAILISQVGESAAAEIDTDAQHMATPHAAPDASDHKTSNRGATFIAGAAILLTLLLAAWSMVRTKTGDLRLLVNVPGASVLVDGIQAPSSASISEGEVMLQLPAGKHIIKIQADGHEPWSETVTIERDQPQRMVVRLAPAGAASETSESSNIANADSEAADTKSPQSNDRKTNTQIASDLPDQSDTDKLERGVAEWVIGLGGNLKLYPRGDAKRLSDLPSGSVRIQNISLLEKNLRDDDIARIIGMSNLQGLEIRLNDLTSEGVKQLGEISTLRWLYMNGNERVDDDAAPHFAKLKALRSLDVSGSQITDATVAKLKRLTKLRELLVASTGVTSRCLQDIGNLKELVRLDLSGTIVSDDGLEHLQQLPILKYLILNSTQITGDAVAVLSQLKTLSELRLRHTDLSPAAIDQLKTSLPDCQIIH